MKNGGWKTCKRGDAARHVSTKGKNQDKKKKNGD